MPLLNVLDCGAKAHSATAKNSPSGLSQFGCLMLRFAKHHNVSAIIRLSHTPMQLRIILMFD